MKTFECPFCNSTMSTVNINSEANSFAKRWMGLHLAMFHQKEMTAHLAQKANVL
jgi:hypothetical protein